MRDKCKLCKEFENGICLIYQRARSAGKKRWCQYFDAKPAKQKMAFPHLRFRTKIDIKKAKKQYEFNMAERKKMQGILDQQKLKEVGSLAVGTAETPAIPKDFISTKKIKIKQSSFSRVVKNMFRRKVI